MAAPVAAGDMPAREPVMYDESRNVAPVRADQLAGEPEAGGRTRGGLFRRRTGVVCSAVTTPASNAAHPIHATDGAPAAQP
jgi:hypothetical protein